MLEVIDEFIYENPKTKKRSVKLVVRCSICGSEKSMFKSQFKNCKKECGQICSQIIKSDVITSYSEVIYKKFYQKYKSLKERCNNVNNVDYNRYGGRGIKSEFASFGEFYKLMFNMFVESYLLDNETTIDRIDVNGNYCKDNIRFVSTSVQNSNKTNNKLFIAISPDGVGYMYSAKTTCAIEHGLRREYITHCLQGKISDYKKWTFRYIVE